MAKPADPIDAAVVAAEQGPPVEPYNVHIRLDPGPGGRLRTVHVQLPGDIDPSEMIATLNGIGEGFFVLVKKRNAKPTDRLWQPGKQN